MPNQITMKAAGPSAAAIATIAAAPANERKVEHVGIEVCQYMKASFNLYLFERDLMPARLTSASAALQKNFVDGELRYV